MRRWNWFEGNEPCFWSSNSNLTSTSARILAKRSRANCRHRRINLKAKFNLQCEILCRLFYTDIHNCLFPHDRVVLGVQHNYILRHPFLSLSNNKTKEKSIRAFRYMNPENLTKYSNLASAYFSIVNFVSGIAFVKYVFRSAIIWNERKIFATY